nr:hypothetical protein [Tanacetum cinerariifolium]
MSVQILSARESELNATYYVYNPTTKQVATLPTRQDCDRIQRPSGVILIFDPLKSSHYRVVFVRGYNYSNDIYSIEIYSSETRIWKLWHIKLDDDKIEFMCGVYWNGSIHWINKKGRIIFLKIDGEASRLYEISTRVVVIDKWYIKRHCCPLVESRDRLMFMGISSLVDMRFDVHEIDKDYSWCTPTYRVDLNQVMVWFLDPLHSFVMHCLVLGEKEEDAFIVLEVPPGNAVKFIIALNTFQELCDLDVSQPFRFSVADDGFSKVGRWPEVCSSKSRSWKLHGKLTNDVGINTEFMGGDRTQMVFSRPLQSLVIHCFVLEEKEEDAFIVLEVPPGKAVKFIIALNTFQELCDLDVSQPFRFSVADNGFKTRTIVFSLQYAAYANM